MAQAQSGSCEQGEGVMTEFVSETENRTERMLRIGSDSSGPPITGFDERLIQVFPSGTSTP